MIKKNAADLQHTFFQILVAMLMVFVLLFCAASPAHAVVGTTSILIPAVIAALESWGISVAADGLDGAAIASWFHEKLTDWSTYASISLSNIVTGIKMTPLGQVLLNPFALNSVRLFADWFVQQYSITSNGSAVPVITSSLTIGNIPVFSSAVLDMVGVNNNHTVKTYSIGIGDSYLWTYLSGGRVYVGCVSFSSGSSISYVYTLNGSTIISSSFAVDRIGSNGLYYLTIDAGPAADSQYWEPVPSNDTMNSMLAQSSPTLVSGDGTLSLVPSVVSVPSSSDVQDKELLINTSLDVGADAVAWYEGVMQKVAANDFTATAAITDAGAITADQVIDQGAITESEGVVLWPDVTTPIGVSGLDEIFPFCIPFDVYHFFQALAADPVAPSFEIPFVIPNIVDYTFELDLSDFDQVAQILRTVELLAFCVGLAFVTRSFFIRG